MVSEDSARRITRRDRSLPDRGDGEAPADGKGVNNIVAELKATFRFNRKAALLGAAALVAALAVAGCGKKGGEPQAQAPQDE